MLTFLGALAAAALGCSDSSATPSIHGAGPGISGPAIDIQITPTSAALNQGGRAVLRCAAFDAHGVMLSNQPAWTTSDPSVATVASDGSVSAQQAGGAVVTCQIGGRSATSAITVSTAQIAFVEVSPGAGTLTTGGSLQLQGVPRDSLGFQVPGSSVQWSSADTTIATVTLSGVVTAKVSGDADIRAVSGGVAGATKIKVTSTRPVPVASVSVSIDQSSLSVGSLTHATATTKDANGNVLSGRSITWSASSPSVISAVTTNPTRSNVRALAQGTSNVIATSEGVSASVPVTVGAPTAAIVVTSLASSSILIGQTTLASAVPEDGLGHPMSGQTVTWISLDPTIASVSSSGVVTGVSAGSVIIRATSDGITGDASVTVSQAAVASVTTSLAASSLTTGQTTQATAVARDASGNTLTGRYVAWSSLNPSVATVSIAGLVTAVAPGTVAIRATVESRTGDATLTVSTGTTPPPTPPASQQPVDTGSVFASSTRTWVNATAPAALVQTPYHPSWTASIPGAQWIWRTAVVANPMAVEVDTFTRRFVPNVSPNSVTLDLASDNGFRVLVNGTLIVDRLLDTTNATYTAASHYVVPTTALVAGTNTLTIIVRNGANPLSSDPAQNPAGLLYSLAISSSQPAAPVSPGPTATVSVTLDSASLATGHTAHATAVAKDANGTILTGKTPSWMSQSTSIATVTSSGVVTGASAGTTKIQATIDGIVGAASLAVTVPGVVTAPAPTAGFPNQPGNFSQLRAQTFDTLENADFYSSGGTYSLVQDPSSPVGSTNVGQIKFPAGFGSGSAPAALFQRVVPFASNPTQVYISFWIKISSNWVGNAAGANKILYMNINRANAGSIEFLGMGGIDGTNQTIAPMLVLENIVNVTGVGSPSAALSPNMVPYTASSAVVRGTWSHYEVLLTLNTPGNADGGVKWWWNGQLYGDYTGRVQWTNTSGSMFTDIYWDPTYGGAGPAVPADQYMWMKNLYVSGR